jgi:hypothetical protein
MSGEEIWIFYWTFFGFVGDFKALGAFLENSENF